VDGYRGVDILTLHVIRSPLEARLNIASGQVSIKNELTISAESSRDPDGGDLAYYWTCYNS